MAKAIGLSRDKMKRRAFHLRSLIGNIKNKKAKQQVIEEYVSLFSKKGRLWFVLGTLLYAAF
jgi:hypothetical protein